MKIYEIEFEEGANPEPHEIQTALFLKKSGKSVRFLAPQNKQKVKTPDIIMDGVSWEIKSPMSNGSRAIEHAFRAAIKQSPNIIFDLRRSKGSDNANVSKIQRQITLIKGKALKRVLVISKKLALLDLK